MPSLRIEVLYGFYLGILTGIVPALVSWALGFVFEYVTGITVPGSGVIVLAVAIAGVNGGPMALNEQTFTQSANQARLSVAAIVVGMLSPYAHNAGDKMGAGFPRRLSLRRLTERTLSTDVVELVGGRGQVKVTVTGDVGDMEGCDPVSPATKEALAGKTLIFSRRLTVAELEGRLVTRIQDDYDVGHVDAELAAGTVEYLALGSRVTGIGSTPAPGTVAVGTDDAVDPFPDDPTLAPGDAVYVVSRPETYRRLDARSRPA